MFQGYRCKSGIAIFALNFGDGDGPNLYRVKKQMLVPAIFAWRVTWNYAYIPF